MEGQTIFVLKFLVKLFNKNKFYSHMFNHQIDLSLVFYQNNKIKLNKTIIQSITFSPN